MPRLITLAEWSEITFGDRKPHRNTLAKWVSDGLIRPYPRKIGRAYFVEPNAEYVDKDAEMLAKML
ncbi:MULTISPECIES: excisionase [unclassified Caballeronia]|uniref:excisionase n=1 Tax=unclassified Caballeronia TaxID=2646786 RepID=UPI002028BD34|nr:MULTISPECIES: excisionase [unclassified Caballeronia]